MSFTSFHLRYYSIHTHSQRQTLKGPLVLKPKLPCNTGVTFCHFLSLTCCPSVVRYQGDFHSHAFQVISFQGGCVQTSCQYILLWTISLVEKENFCPLCWPLLCLYLFSWKSIPNHFPPTCIALIYLRRVDWAVSTHSSVSASPCFTFTQSHTRSSWSLRLYFHQLLHLCFTVSAPFISSFTTS